jgi:hypothetical protein
MGEEEAIRDQLAIDLSVIDPELRFIQTEYPLPNDLGSKGFVDILATDIFNNHVIIEIKRSKTSSRETLQQIYKYIGLLRQNYHARDSQMRAIIVSTHWEELLVAFLEFIRLNTFFLTGYKIHLDENNRIIRAEKIDTEDMPQYSRQLCRRYPISFFSTIEKRDAYVAVLANKSNALGIRDFLIVSMQTTNTLRVMFPFAICFAFNRLRKEDYQATLAHKGIRHMKEQEFEEAKDFVDHLEQTLLCELPGAPYRDFMEVTGPKGLEGMLQDQHWQISRINRHGFFQTDPRLTDDMLVIELKGLDGNSPGRYSNFSSSTQPDRVREIVQNCAAPLEGREEWTEGLLQVLQWIQTMKASYRFAINVFCPTSVFNGIYHSIKQSDPEYLPSFLIIVFIGSENKQLVFQGRLEWTGLTASHTGFVDFTRDNRRTFVNKVIDMIMLGSFDDQTLSLLNLEWVIGMKTFMNEVLQDERLICFDAHGSIQGNPRPHWSFDKWVKHHPQLCRHIVNLCDSHLVHV